MRSPSLLLIITLALAACSGADQEPLGGPHGGALNQPVGVVPGNPSSGVDAGGGVTPTGVVDAGTVQSVDAAPVVAPPATGPCTPGPAPASAPTFTQIYTTYFAPGAPVDCATGAGCHTEFATASGAWGFLLTNKQVGTSPPAITNPATSDLLWYGGFMPETGAACNPGAVAALNAWAAAGAKDD